MLFLSQRMAYGIYLPFAKLQAFIDGDTSGTILHPFFVFLGHLCGCQFWQEHVGRYCLLHLQAGYLRSTLDAFSSMKEEDDPLSLAQACWSMSVVQGVVQQPNAFRQFKRCLDILRRNRIRFVPLPTDISLHDCSLPAFTEHVHERAAFLAQTVFAEAFIYISGQPDSPASLHRNEHKSQSSTRVKSYLDYCKTEFFNWDVRLIDGKLEEMSLTEQFRYHLPVCRLPFPSLCAT